MKNNSHSRGFDARRQNKYSIRRFTVGTASIIVGATLLFGVGNEARAAEADTDTNSTQDAKNTNGQSVDSDPVEADTNTNEAPEIETDAPSEDVKEEAPKAEETPSEDVSTSEQDSTDVQKEDDTTQDETSTQEENEATQKDNSSEQNTSDSNKAETRDEDTTSVEQTDGKTQSSNSVDTTKVNESTPQSETSETQTSNEKLQNSNLNNDAEKVTDESGESTADSDNTPQQLTAADTDLQQPVEESKAQNENGLSNNEEVQQLAEQAGVKATDTPEVAMAKILKQSSDNKENNTVQATATQPSAMRRMMAYNAVEPQSTSSNTTTPTAQAIEAYASPSQGTTAPIVADAIANGYIKGQTDATNAKNTLSGRAWVVDKGTPATMSNGLTAVPEGTDVYMQWVDKDGAVSPVYTAKTSNQLSKSNGSQVGPGAYAFDLREGWTDLNGTTHKYNASSGQDYRLWINDYETEHGNTATMLRQAGGFFPGTFVNSVTNSNLGQFPLAGTNMQRTGIYMAVKPTGGYMEKDEADQIHDTEGPISSPSVNTNAKNTVSGKVWLETGAGDYANSATGPNDNAADPQADGYTVVMSSLTGDGAKAYDAAINNLPEDEKADAVKTLLEEHPEYISATVYGETDEDGRYTLRFPDGTLNTQHMYGYVKNPEGHIVNTYSSFTSPQFRAPNSNLSWTPQTAPAQNVIVNPMWYNVNFAVVPTADLALDILKYDTTTTPATPGSNVDIALPGTTVSPLPTHIEWRDSSGNVLVKTPEFTTIEEGEQLGKFQVPSDAKAGDIYTAYLVTGGNDVSADSLIVKSYEESYDPESSEVTNPYNTPTTEDQVTGNITIPDYPEDQEQPEITVNDPSSLPDGTEPGTVDVDVTVTYPDGTTDQVTVPVTTASPLNDEYDPTTSPVNNPNGTPTTEDQVVDNVTVPNYPEDQEQPEITVDDPSLLPDGTEPGTVDVDVTVTYPDGTIDHVKVPVTTGDTTASQYDPTAEPVETPYGTPTTEEDVTGNVTVPNYPEDQEQPEITVDDPSLLPDGTEPGTTEVPVTVTYPDGSQDKVIVNVTTGNPQAENYEPTTEPVETPYGTPTTEEDVTGNVTVPNYPEDQEQPEITVDNPSLLPDGTEPGTVDVDVTVTYPDGTIDHVKVPVTTGNPQTDNPQAENYDPTTEPVETPYGTPTTEEDVTGNVTVPNYPEDQEQPEITVDNPSELPDGTEPGTVDVDVTVTYPDGSTDHVKVPVTTGDETSDTTAPDAPPINPIESGSTTVTGTGEPDSTITVTYPDGSTSEATVDQDGNWTTKVPEGTTLNEGDTVTATATDDAGNTSEASSQTVTGDSITAPDAPPINPVESGSTTVTGTGNPGDTITVTFPDGNTTTGTVDEDGNWTVDVPEDTTLNNGDTVKATATDDAGNTSTESSVTVTDTVAPDAPEINGVTDGDTTVSGNGTPGDTITVTFPDGSTATGTVDEDGNWTVDVPEGTPVKKDDVISATATDDAGNTSESTTVTVTGDNTTAPDNQVTTPDAPVINPVDKTDDAVTGTGTPGNDVTVTFPDGSTATGTVDEDGNWTVDVPEGSHLQDGDNITAVETDKDGNTSKETSVTVTGDQNNVTPPANNDNQGDSTVVTPDAPEINEVPTNSPSVTGTGTPGHTVEVTFPDGHVETTTVNDQGSWSVQVPQGESLENGNVVTAVDVDQSGNPSEVVRATVGDEGNTEEALPDTGETNNANNATLFGGLFAALGSIFLFGRRRKDNKDNQ